MKPQNYAKIIYYDPQGGRMFSEIVRSGLDYFGMCTAIASDLPNGADDFKALELPRRPTGLPEEPRRLFVNRNCCPSCRATGRKMRAVA